MLILLWLLAYIPDEGNANFHPKVSFFVYLFFKKGNFSHPSLQIPLPQNKNPAPQHCKDILRDVTFSVFSPQNTVLGP